MLTEAPQTVLVLGGLEGWAAGMASAGAEVVESPSEPPELAVAPAAAAAEAAAAGAQTVLVEGRGARDALSRSFPVVERFLPIPTIEEPHLLVPLAHSRAADYAVRNWSLATTWRRRLRNEVARALLRRGLLPELRSVVTVGARRGGDPFLVRAMRPLGVPEGCQWFLTLGLGDPLTRGVFHLFPPASDEPGWVLKFSRVPGYSDPFDRDERGLGVAAAAGQVVLGHAPRLLGRRDVEGLPAALETSAVGSRLTLLLQGRATRKEKVRAIEAVADWTVEAGRATAGPAERLELERRRLAEEVVPVWSDLGVPAGLVEEVGPVPAVVQHNDLGSWNIVARSGTEFTAVDWESARAAGLPLWDLVYFLTDALTHLDGASETSRRDAHNLRLFSGQLPSSTIMFGWIRRTCEALGIAEEWVGPIVTLCWLHHGLSGGHRRHALGAHAPEHAATGEPSDAERIARLWIRSPGLGVGWDAWLRR